MASKKKADKTVTQYQKIDRLYMVQLVLICLAVFLAPIIAGKMLPAPAFVIQLLVFTACGIWLYRSIFKSQIELPGKPILYILAIFSLLVFVSIFSSINKGLSLREFLNTSSYLLLFLLVISYGKKQTAVFSILASLCLSALIVSVIGLNEYIVTASSGWRTFSTFFNPDFLAGFTAMMLPVTLAWYLSAKSIKVSIITGVTSAFIFANLLLTGSRLGFIAAMGGIILFAIFSLLSKSIKKPQMFKIAIMAVPVLLVMIMLSTPLAARMGSVAAVKAESHSGSFRLLTWKGTAKMAISNPILGTGIGTFEEGYSRYAIVGFTKLAHNSYLQLAGEAGIPALLALLVLLGITILPIMWSVIKNRKDDSIQVTNDLIPDPKLVLYGVIAGCIASIARNAVDSDWYITSIGISFWTLAGLGISISGRSKTVSIKPGCLKASLAVSVIFFLYGFMLLMGELWNQSARSQLVAGNAESAITYYKTAQRYESLNADYHRRLGTIYSMTNIGLDSNSLNSAVDEYQAAIRLAPYSAKGYYQLARVYEKSDKTDDAIETYKKSLEYDPQSPQTMLMLARQYQLANRNSDALDIYRQMIAIEESPYEGVRAVPEIVEPSYIFAHKVIGDDYVSKGETSKAAEEYKRAKDRLDAYQTSMKGYGAIFDASGTRNRDMESEVESIKPVIIQMINKLEKH